MAILVTTKMPLPPDKTIFFPLLFPRQPQLTKRLPCFYGLFWGRRLLVLMGIESEQSCIIFSFSSSVCLCVWEREREEFSYWTSISACCLFVRHNLIESFVSLVAMKFLRKGDNEKDYSRSKEDNTKGLWELIAIAKLNSVLAKECMPLSWEDCHPSFATRTWTKWLVNGGNYLDLSLFLERAFVAIIGAILFEKRKTALP